MQNSHSGFGGRARVLLQMATSGPQILAFIPAIILGGYWLGGEGAMVVLALSFPVLLVLASFVTGPRRRWSNAKDIETGLAMREIAENLLTQSLSAELSTGRTAAALAIELDELISIEEQFGKKAATGVLRQAAARVASSCRDTDVIVRLTSSRFGVALGAMPRADLETLIGFSARLQSDLSEPYSIDAARVFLTASVGFCLPGRAPARSGAAMIDCAECALDEARANGAGSIRAYSPDMKRKKHTRSALGADLVTALESGQIRPWFQPQISTDTGEVTGFEALARWEHPDHGVLPAREFAPAIAENHAHDRLSEIMLGGALSALSGWDEDGLNVPSVAVNFGTERLSDPKLCDKIRWELERFGLAPERLRIEILEDVIASAKDDMIVTNIAAISEMGCPIDLDDFGTGHASISNIRRFAADRIKIDKSFVTRVDRDRDQQNMVTAILTMAERLSLETIAEGVETAGEHAMLAQLGCGAVQGHSVSRPIRREDVGDWLRQHEAKLPEPNSITSNRR